MVALIRRVARYLRRHHPDPLIVPLNSPELRLVPGFDGAADAIAVEGLFFEATDVPATADYTETNLRHVRALADRGVPVLAIDYAEHPHNVATAWAAYARHGFIGYVGPVALDRARAPARPAAARAARSDSSRNPAVTKHATSEGG